MGAVLISKNNVILLIIEHFYYCLQRALNFLS